jgi:hypothetical protein
MPTPTQGSQARRRVEIPGPKARKLGNCGRVFDRLIGILGPKRGAFRPIFPPKCTCTKLARPQRAPGGQLVEIGQGPSTNWSKSPRVACEPCSNGLFMSHGGVQQLKLRVLAAWTWRYMGLDNACHGLDHHEPPAVRSGRRPLSLTQQ